MSKSHAKPQDKPPRTIARADDSEIFMLPAFRASKAVWATAALALMVVGGAAIAGLGERRFPWEAVLALGMAMTPAIGVVWWLSRSAGIPRATPLVISREGIHAPAMAARPVPWDKIEAVTLTPSTYRGTVTGLMMVLNVADSSAFGPSGSAFVRKMNRLKYGSDLQFPIAALDRPAEEVAGAVRRFAPAGVVVRG